MEDALMKCLSVAVQVYRILSVENSPIQDKPVRFAGLLWLKVLFAGLL
jgi:hypothetical protein